METKTILWIDDDINHRPLRPFIDELEEYDLFIIKVENIDDISSTLNNIDGIFLSVIIIDIAMGTGNSISLSKAGGGYKTGKIILERLLKNEKLNRIPKVVFTQVDDEEVKTYCENNDIPYLKKEDYLPDEFADEILKIIN